MSSNELKPNNYSFFKCWKICWVL